MIIYIYIIYIYLYFNMSVRFLASIKSHTHDLLLFRWLGWCSDEFSEVLSKGCFAADPGAIAQHSAVYVSSDFSGRTFALPETT